MSVKLKPIDKQVIFLTGATSGIGLSTLRMAAEMGAKVFMVARNEDELQKIQDEMRTKNYATAYAVVDVAEKDQLQVAAEQCLQTFGTIDTWVNNAGFSIYEKVLDTPDEEAHRLFDTNFWGVVNGCKVAVDAMKDTGGTIINIGSVLSEIGLPIQGIYSASKHAVKGYTDALRRELMAEKRPIHVSLIMPGAIDTPFTLNAKSRIGEPVHAPPVYHPDVVARMILKCAQKPVRELGVGAQAYLFPVLDRLFPGLQDKLMSRFFMEDTQRKNSKRIPQKLEGEEQGNYEGHVMRSSVLTEVASKPWLKRGLVVSALSFLILKRKTS